MMAEPKYDDRKTTIQGMIDSNFMFKVDPVFLALTQWNQDLEKKISGKVISLILIDYEKTAAEKVGLILSCDIVDLFYHNSENMFSGRK